MTENVMPPGDRRILPLLAWAVGLVVVIGVLVAGGRGRLATPPWHGFTAWVEAEGSVVAAVALARLVALALAGWLLVTTAVALGAALLGYRPPALVTLPLVRRLVNGAVGVGIVVGAVGATGAAAYASKPQASSPTMVRLPSETVTMQRLPDEPAPAAVPPAASPAAAELAAPPSVDGGHHQVEPGDHFWAVATNTLNDAWHREPTEAETIPYWRSLIEANRASLADPENPDLLFPGQTIVVPPPPPAPATPST